MKVTVSRKELNDALNIAASASSSRTALPVLSSLRLTADGASLSIVGCDGEMWASVIIAANVEVDGAVCVQQKLLSDIVSALNDGMVTLELVGTQVFLRAGMSEWKMLALPAEEFPGIPAMEPTLSLTIAASQIKRAIEGVAFAVSDDTSRPVLTGVLFQYDGDTLTLVATDTHRLAVHRIQKDGLGSDIKVTVPAKALRTLKMLPVAPDAPLTLSFDESRMMVDIGFAKVVSQLLVGTYPNWERVVPTETTRLWTVDRKEFHDNVKRIMILARDNSNRVRFVGEGEKVVISAISQDKGEAKEEVPIVSQNGEIEIAFNGRYVIDALEALGGDGVQAEMTESSKPAILRPTENGAEHFCVVMPMAIG